MTMTPDEARAVERPPIVVGKSYEFYAEMQQGGDPPATRMRNYTGQQVTVIRNLRRDEYDGPGPDDKDDDAYETSRAFIVRAENGQEFTALLEELNGWDRDLGQFFWPDGTHGPDHDRSFLANER